MMSFTPVLGYKKKKTIKEKERFVPLCRDWPSTFLFTVVISLVPTKFTAFSLQCFLVSTLAD